ncbi:MAG: tannase/feruloyl esterase family alpha/beta hydrolase, partial [Vicinamibacterales bacterium]
MTLAETVAPGQFTPPPGSGRGGPASVNVYATLPSFCRVAATLRPSNDSEIKIEVWMPVSGWNGKFLASGNGGWAGTIGYAALADGLRRGYAAASTDTGHTVPNGSFIIDHPEKLIDFADRAVHEMAAKGKAIAAAHYASPPKFAYFNGCSTGGRQALTAAQRYPDDFNGIIGGAPAIYGSHQSAGQIWIWQATHKDEASFIPQTKYAVLHDAVLAACDALDGVTDGVLEDPTRCEFDPKVVQCKDADGPDCLTAPQVEAARKIYAGPVSPRTGKQIFPGLYPGSELGWGASAGAQPVSYASDLYKYVVFKNANWDPLTLNFDSDVARAEKVATPLIAIDSDLRKFALEGRKLLIYMGWGDPGIPPGYTPEYYKNVVSKLGEKSAQNSVRLFMVPGMGHCGGGEGTSTFDMISVMEQWVEQGKAPAQIPASRVKDGKVDRTRPLCPYPQSARYKG